MTMDRFKTYLSSLGAVQLLGITFLVYAIVRSHDYYSAIYLLTLAAFFIYGYTLPYLERFIWWVGISLTVSLFLLLTPWFPNGIFGNPNYLGAAMVIGLALAITYTHFEFIPGYLFGLYWAQSRGAVIAAGVVGLIAIWRWSKLWAVVAFCIAILGALWFSSGGRGVEAFINRLGVWQDTLNHLTLWGHGFGSFASEYASWPVRRNMTLELAPHAYNDFLELIFELGLGVIPLWCLIAISFESGRHGHLILCAYFALSLTYFPFYLPGVGHISVMVLGHLAGSLQLQRKPQWLVGS